MPPSHTGPVRARNAPPAPQPSQGPGLAAWPDARPRRSRRPPPRLFGAPPRPATPRPALTCASQRRSWLYRALPSRKPSRHTEYSCKHTAVRPAPGPAGPPPPSPPRAHHVAPPAPLPQLLGGGDAEVQLHGEPGPGRPLTAAAGLREGGGAGGRARRQGALPWRGPRALRRDRPSGAASAAAAFILNLSRVGALRVGGGFAGAKLMVNKRQAVAAGEAAWLGRAAGATRGAEEPVLSGDGGGLGPGRREQPRKGDSEVVVHCEVMIIHCFPRHENSGPPGERGTRQVYKK